MADTSNATTQEATTSEASQGTENPLNIPKKLVAMQPTGARRALPIGTNKKRKTMETKSTTTTTTAAVHTPVNVYDAVLGEAEDLLEAAAEAQALGRLKMASAYQLLLHARLVGLAKRFDRAQVQGSEEEESGETADSPESLSSTNSKESTHTSASAAATTEQPQQSSSSAHLHAGELAKMLPPQVEIDGAMMEHLARAAMELHHQRTGRRIASDSVVEAPVASTSIAWTEQERAGVQQALDAGVKDPAVIAVRIKTRTEAQVRAYLRNSKERQKGSEQIEEEITFRRGGRGRKPPTQAMNTVPNAKLDAKALLSGKGL